MSSATIPIRIVGGQSRFDTLPSAAMAGWTASPRRIVVKMLLTILLLDAIKSPSRANEAAPHAVAVVVARAEIVSGVRVMQPSEPADAGPQNRKVRLPRPRERPCPEASETPCRLFVVDMP